MLPHGWIRSKVRYLAEYVNGAAFKPDDWGDGGSPIIRIQNLTDPGSDFNYFSGELPSKYRVRQGDILLPWSASPGIYTWDRPEAGWLNQHIFKVRPRERLVEKRFFYWLASWFIPEMEHTRHGSTMQHFTWDAFASFDVPLPPLEEQTLIANFLDCETAKADTLIEKYERLIELLEEKRASLITQAVTKGLDPTVPLKNSGVDWIGDVPSQWNLSRLKHVTSIPITDGPHETPEFVDDGVPFVSAEAVKSGKIDFAKIRGCISSADHNRYCRKYKPLRDDIFLVKSGATTGKSAIVETDLEFSIWSPLAAIRCSRQMQPRFMLYFLKSRSFQDGIALNWSFGTQQNIGMGVIENLPLPVPPIVEQDAIIAYVDRETQAIERLTAKTVTAMTLVRERRSAIITAAVTGQVDVASNSVEVAADI